MTWRIQEAVSEDQKGLTQIQDAIRWIPEAIDKLSDRIQDFQNKQLVLPILEILTILSPTTLKITPPAHLPAPPPR